jgi:hypothetical protein
MPDPKLTREVELPRPSSNGAAVVAIASAAMFMAVGASAFVVRVRMQRDLAMPQAIVDAERRLATESPPAEPFRAGFLSAVNRGDDELALEWYANLPDLSETAVELAPLRESVANRYFKDQLKRLHSDLDANDCASVNERLTRLRHLLPEHQDLPEKMAPCAADYK